jgi:hypothetical protein
MRVLDKRSKDYYDYLSFQYGEPDKSITFARQDARKITGDDLLKFVLRNMNKDSYDLSFTQTFMLEAGYVQWLFGLDDIVIKDGKRPEDPQTVTARVFLIRKFTENIHIFQKELSIAKDLRVKTNGYWWRFNVGNVKSIREINFKYCMGEKQSCNRIDLPILSETQIPAIIPAQELYAALDNYVTARNNDKDVSIPLTDVDKAINHGFDKKTSFRNPTKLSELKVVKQD